MGSILSYLTLASAFVSSLCEIIEFKAIIPSNISFRGERRNWISSYAQKGYYNGLTHSTRRDERGKSKCYWHKTNERRKQKCHQNYFSESEAIEEIREVLLPGFITPGKSGIPDIGGRGIRMPLLKSPPLIAFKNLLLTNNQESNSVCLITLIINNFPWLRETFDLKLSIKPHKKPI